MKTSHIKHDKKLYIVTIRSSVCRLNTCIYSHTDSIYTIASMCNSKPVLVCSVTPFGQTTQLPKGYVLQKHILPGVVVAAAKEESDIQHSVHWKLFISYCVQL